MNTHTTPGTVVLTDGMGFPVKIGDRVECATGGGTVVLVGTLTEWCERTNTLLLTNGSDRYRVALDLMDEIYPL